MTSFTTTRMASLIARTTSEMSTASTVVEHHVPTIEPYPELVMTFALIPFASSTTDGSCAITLTHPGTTDQYLAFKVKTRQPRKYLVRPNQGLLAPSGSVKVVIIMVEQEKKRFLQTYSPTSRPPLLRNVFLIESYAVPKELSASFLQFKQMQNHEKMKNLLTTMWKSVSGSKQVFHQKLRVRHNVVKGEDFERIEQSITKATALENNQVGQSNVVSSLADLNEHPTPVEEDLPRFHPECHLGDMSVASSHQASPARFQWMIRLLPFRIFHRHQPHDDCKSWTSVCEKEPVLSAAAKKLSTELTSLQQKYDQLATFSKQLEVERDMLKSQLEQTQRDLMKERRLVKPF